MELQRENIKKKKQEKWHETSQFSTQVNFNENKA